MDKRVFDDAIGEVPPSTINVEATITRGRRAARLRSVANPVAAAGVAVVLVAGAVAFTMMGDNGGSPQVGAQPPAETKTETAPPKTSTSRKQVTMPPEACSRTDLETSAQVVARLTSAAKAVVADERPDLQLSPDPSEGLHGPGALEFNHYFLDEPDSTNKPICHKHAGFAAAATTDGPEGKGTISISVDAVSFNPSGFCDEYSGTYCEEVTGPNGEIIVKYQVQEDDGSTSNAKAAYVLRQDGTLIRLDAQNASRTGTAPLDYDQLVAIGTDPGMTLFP